MRDAGSRGSSGNSVSGSSSVSIWSSSSWCWWAPMMKTVYACLRTDENLAVFVYIASLMALTPPKTRNPKPYVPM